MEINKLLKNCNREKIEKVISEVQGKSTSRTLTYDDIVTVLERVLCHYGVSGAKLSIDRMSKSAFVGTEVAYYVGADNFARSYKYIPFGTYFHATYTKSGWRIDGVERRDVNHKDIIYVRLPEEAKQSILSREQEKLYCYIRYGV